MMGDPIHYPAGLGLSKMNILCPTESHMVRRLLFMKKEKCTGMELINKQLGNICVVILTT